MPVRIVQSKQNARLKELRHALAKPDRAMTHAGHALAGIEGPNLLEEAIRAGLRIDCVFLAQSSVGLLDGLRLEPETEILLVPRELLDSALTTEAPQAIAALVEPPQWNWADLLNSQGNVFPLIIVLAGIQDPGNLGTILRSAEAFGASGILSLPGTVSAWNPKAVRASAGSVFRLPLLSAGEEDGLARLREAGLTLWTTAVNRAQPTVHSLDRIDLAAAVALLIGNEGNGVPKELAALTDGALMIPCPGPVESLNAAVAASVLLYESSRQRSSQGRKHKSLKTKTGSSQ